MILAKGGGEGEEGGDILGDFIDALSGFDLSPGSGSEGSLSNIAPHGNFNEHPNSTVRVWLGPLGTSLESQLCLR